MPDEGVALVDERVYTSDVKPKIVTAPPFHGNGLLKEKQASKRSLKSFGGGVM